MDAVPQKPSQNKSPLLVLITTEGSIVAVLVVLILLTFNYFNILPISKILPFLPHQEEKIYKKPRTSQYRTNFTQGEYVGLSGCPSIPRNALIPKRDPAAASMSADLVRFLGAWEGKWDEKTPTALIIATINSKKAAGKYFYSGGEIISGSFYNVDGNKLTTPNEALSWEFVGEELRGTHRSGSESATVAMRRCDL